MTVIDINHTKYSEVTSQEGTVIVKVSSPTCGPCKMMAAVFNKIATESEEDSTKFYAFEVDSDDDKALARSLGVSSVPAFLVYKDGEKLTQFSGAFPASVLKNKLDI